MSTFRSFRILTTLTFALCHLSLTAAQLVNGQFFTQGLAISNAPAPLSDQHAGSNMVISIDLSGDGHLPQENFLPNSSASTAYQSLNLYLISSETNVNITISEGPGLLEQELGSTVKHLNWPIPSCLPAGNYNYTFYEQSRVNGVLYYSITPIPVSLKSQTSSSSACTSDVVIRPAEVQPQPSSPPESRVWLTATTTTMTMTSTLPVTSTLNGLQTVILMPTTWTTTSTINQIPTDGTFFPVNTASALSLNRVVLFAMVLPLAVFFL